MDKEAVPSLFDADAWVVRSLDPEGNIIHSSRADIKEDLQHAVDAEHDE